MTTASPQAVPPAQLDKAGGWNSTGYLGTGKVRFPVAYRARHRQPEAGFSSRVLQSLLVNSGCIPVVLVLRVSRA
jgi:hypothetical protein